MHITEEDSSFHVEQPVGSMSISPCGRDVVLASKEGLHSMELDMVTAVVALFNLRCSSGRDLA
jgi:uncharacterized protein with WD repeat